MGEEGQEPPSPYLVSPLSIGVGTIVLFSFLICSQGCGNTREMSKGNWSSASILSRETVGHGGECGKQVSTCFR